MRYKAPSIANPGRIVKLNGKISRIPATKANTRSTMFILRNRKPSIQMDIQITPNMAVVTTKIISIKLPCNKRAGLKTNTKGMIKEGIAILKACHPVFIGLESAKPAAA
jgi:hypothetical protein